MKLCRVTLEVGVLDGVMISVLLECRGRGSSTVAAVDD